MKKCVKMLIITLVTVILFVTLSGSGFRSVWDSTYSFDRAIIKLADGTIVDGDVESWLDFEDGDQIQVKIDGNIYLVHISNATLIKNR